MSSHEGTTLATHWHAAALVPAVAGSGPWFRRQGALHAVGGALRRCRSAVGHGNSRQGNRAASAAAALCSERHAAPSAATAPFDPFVPPQRRFRQCHIHLPIKATAACPRDGFPSGCALRWHSGCGARFACCCRGLTLPFLSPSFPCSMTSLLASWASRPACFCGRYPLREPVDEASTSMTLPPTPAALLPPSELSLPLHVRTESPFCTSEPAIRRRSFCLLLVCCSFSFSSNFAAASSVVAFFIVTLCSRCMSHPILQMYELYQTERSAKQ